MFRETMDDDHGMLFVFEQSRPVSFWMRNTPMPLDLVFIDATGSVRDILPGEPFSETPIGPAAPVKFVLELKRGVADTAGIEAGRHCATSGDRGPGRQVRASPLVSILKGIAGAMQFFEHEGFEAGVHRPASGRNREPILLVHGFASNHVVNWVSTGWVRTLNDAGHRVIAFDNRGHGQSSGSYDAADYTPQKMAGDAAALLRHLGIGKAHVMGYSMGARISAFLAIAEPDLVATLVFGGLGSGMVDGVGDWDPIADALLAEDPATISSARGKMFRTFADQTKSDRRALAACIATSRELLDPSDMAGISQPTLVAVGTRDEIGGSPDALARLMPAGESFAIEGRDHMLAVGDRTFKQRVLEFLADHPIGDS